jgi:hypothetical protein
MFTILIIFGTVFVLAPIAKAYADRIGRSMPLDDASRAEIGRLRDEVERLSGQVARLEEEHSFMVKLLDDGVRKQLGEGSRDAG